MEFLKKYLLFILVFSPILLLAKHIVGGEISYKFLSSNDTSSRLSFTLKLYKDCSSLGAADFDQLALITIFQKSNNKMVTSLYIQLESRMLIANNYPAVFIGPNSVCVEEGIYEWEQGLNNLSDTTDSYIITYQRCCRNFEVVNIYDSNNVGSTYTLEITQYALDQKNNSPDFKQWPPSLLCSNQSVDFDHSAADIENDQLIYHFCEPLSGGGPVASADGCFVPLPTPACYPPNDKIIYKTPYFSFDKPLGSTSTFNINPTTGILYGIAPDQGRYLVAVCVTNTGMADYSVVYIVIFNLMW